MQWPDVTDKTIFPKTYNPALSRYFPILYLKKLLLLALLRMGESATAPAPPPPPKKQKKQTNEAISVFGSYSSITKIVQQKNTICSL